MRTPPAAPQLLGFLLGGCGGAPLAAEETAAPPAPEVSADTLCEAERPSGTLRVEPESVDFGVVEVGGSVEARVSLLPDGEEPLALCSVVQQGSGGFFVEVNPAGLPRLVPTEGVELVVRFAPGEAGLREGRVWLGTTEGEPRRIAITGEGRED